MKTPLRVLHLEDNPHDAELIRCMLQKEGFQCDLVVVQTKAEFATALAGQRFDLILSDFGLVDYDGLAALALAQSTQPDVPFILISGTLGEEQAVESLKTGATDYVLKNRLSRLVPAVRRALLDSRKRAGLTHRLFGLAQFGPFPGVDASVRIQVPPSLREPERCGVSRRRANGQDHRYESTSGKVARPDPDPDPGSAPGVVQSAGPGRRVSPVGGRLP